MNELLALAISLSVFVLITYLVSPPSKLYEWLLFAERRLAKLTLRKLDIQEGQIAYQEGGKGEVLMLLHGFGANKDTWNRIAQHLTPYFHVIAIDLPGFGNSFKDMQLQYDVKAQVTRLQEIVEGLKLSQFHLAGNSMGGYIAANYAALHPDKLSSLWLLNPLGVATAPNSGMFEDIAQKKRPVVLANSKLEYKELIARVFHKAPYMPNFFVDALSLNAIANFSINKKIFHEIHQTADYQVYFSSPTDLALAGFDKPLLITWGNKDTILHPKGAHALQKVVPSAVVQIIENVGHLPMIESPKLTANQFIEFRYPL